MTKYFTYGMMLLGFSLFVIGCSDLKEEKIPTQSAISVHGEGFANPSSSNFHGTYLQSINDDLTKCQTCHAKNFSGGIAKSSCLECHKAIHGSDAGDPSSQNFHAKYLQANQYDVGSCQSCHGVNFEGKGSANKSCYKCHTVVHSNNFGMNHVTFIKNNNYNITTCQSCHGVKFDGGGVSSKTCLTCHNKPNGPENCTTCHGGANAAPPNDLNGNSSSTVRGVGAHQKHLLGGLLSAAIACAECHNVPSTLLSAGHIDNTANAEIMFDSTSKFFKSNATYNSSNVSCSNTYCHGNFNGGNQSNTPVWTGSAQCGTCHGDVNETTPEKIAFPKSGHPAIGTYTCVQCHYKVINASMAIIDPSKHMNGKID